MSLFKYSNIPSNISSMNSSKDGTRVYKAMKVIIGRIEKQIFIYLA